MTDLEKLELEFGQTTVQCELLGAQLRQLNELRQQQFNAIQTAKAAVAEQELPNT